VFLISLIGCDTRPWYVKRSEADSEFRLVYERCRQEAEDTASRRYVILKTAIEACLQDQGYRVRSTERH
jgi:hypothetical protein